MNSNWEILTKILLLLKFNIFGLHRKIRYSEVGEVSGKTNTKGGLPKKREGWDSFLI